MFLAHSAPLVLGIKIAQENADKQDSPIMSRMGQVVDVVVYHEGVVGVPPDHVAVPLALVGLPSTPQTDSIAMRSLLGFVLADVVISEYCASGSTHASGKHVLHI
eukprot:1219675-Rhodomonas_salina.1